MPTMIFTYSPKPGVSAAEFEKFLREVDQPVTLSLPAALSSRIFRVKSEGAAFAYIEVLEISSFEEWARDSKRPEVQQIVGQWADYGDVAQAKAYQCEEWYVGKK